MIYFLNDLSAGLTRMVRFLKPGSELFVVFADEIDSYTGLVVKRFIEGGGDSGDNARHLSDIAERRHLLGSPLRAVVQSSRYCALPGRRRISTPNVSRVASMDTASPT